MVSRIANREDPDQTASDLGLCCFSLGLFDRQLLFKILVHVPHFTFTLLKPSIICSRQQFNFDFCFRGNKKQM